MDFDSNGDVERCGGRPRFAFDSSKMQSGRRRSSQAFALPAEDINKVSSRKGNDGDDEDDGDDGFQRY